MDKPLPQHHYIDVEQLSTRWGRSISAIRRDWYSGLIPAPVRVGRRSIRWRISEILQWEAAQQPYTPEPKERSHP